MNLKLDKQIFKITPESTLNFRIAELLEGCNARKANEKTANYTYLVR